MKTLKRTILKKSLLAVLLITAFSACQKDQLAPDQTNNEIVGQDLQSETINGYHIVELSKTFATVQLIGITDYQARDEILRENIEDFLTLTGHNNVEVGLTFNTALKGFSAKLTESERASLLLQPQVLSIEADITMHIESDITPLPTNEYQSNPAGIQRVGSSSGLGKLAYIIDTGIDMDHPDLHVNESKSISYVGAGLLGFLFEESDSPDDEHGHGTHVAGTVAAMNNNIGVKGVAYGAEVASVRVLDKNGSGANSTVIKGVDYVAAHAIPGNVVNMSLGGKTSDILDLAISNASNEGILFAIAAGNDGQDASNTSPARVNGPNIYTVSAIDQKDNRASFSNFGNPPIDFAAPGVDVHSTFLKGGYASMTGTSMAAPHVAGILLINQGSPSTDGHAIGDNDNTPDPIAVL